MRNGKRRTEMADELMEFPRTIEVLGQLADDVRQVDIARVEGVSENVVDLRKHRAIERLRKMLTAEKKVSKKP